MVNFKPNKDKLLIETFKDASTSSGIILDAEKHPMKGTVVATALGMKEFSEGDTVYFIKYSGSEIDVNGSKYTVMSKNDILGITW